MRLRERWRCSTWNLPCLATCPAGSVRSDLWLQASSAPDRIDASPTVVWRPSGARDAGVPSSQRVLEPFPVEHEGPRSDAREASEQPGARTAPRTNTRVEEGPSDPGHAGHVTGKCLTSNRCRSSMLGRAGDRRTLPPGGTEAGIVVTGTTADDQPARRPTPVSPGGDTGVQVAIGHGRAWPRVQRLSTTHATRHPQFHGVIHSGCG